MINPKTYVLHTKGGKEQYLADLLTNTVLRLYPESANRIYVPYKAVLTKSAQTGQKWIEEKTILFPNYVFVESNQIEIFNTHLYEPGFDTGYHLIGKGSARLPKGSYRSMTGIKQKGPKIETAGQRYIFPVSDEDMDRIRALMNADDFVAISRGIKENGRVRFISGPLVGHEADVVTINRHGRYAKVLIEFLGEMRQVDVAVEVLNAVPTASAASV